MDHDTRGNKDGLSGERNPDALEHHPEEDDQVSVLADQGENVVYGLQDLPILSTQEPVRRKASA